MSDDFRFDDDDDFNFDDDFDFGDDLGDDAGGDDLSYDEFSDDVDLDADNFDFGDDEGDELDFIDGDDSGGGGGPSRTFLLIAGVLIIILLAGVVLLILALTGSGNSDLDITRTAIAQQNETTEALIRATQTQDAVNAGLTQTATLFTATPSPSPSPTATDTPDAAATQSIIDATNTAEAIIQQTALALTEIALTADVTEIPVEETEDVGPTPTGISAVQAAQMTATALADLFNQTPTVGATTAGTTTTTTGGTTGEMPDTGLFDDIGTDNAGVFFLMAFGLLGVIVGSRRLRSLNKRKRR